MAFLIFIKDNYLRINTTTLIEGNNNLYTTNSAVLFISTYIILYQFINGIISAALNTEKSLARYLFGKSGEICTCIK